MALEPFLLPDVAPLVVPVHLPIAVLVLRDELDFGEPLRALPAVEVWHERPGWKPLRWEERLAVEHQRDYRVLAERVLNRDWRGVPLVAPIHYPGRLGLDLSLVCEQLDGDSFPHRFLNGPFCHTEKRLRVLLHWKCEELVVG